MLSVRPEQPVEPLTLSVLEVVASVGTELGLGDEEIVGLVRNLRIYVDCV